MKEIQAIVLATHNRDKREELQEALSEFMVEILSLNDFPFIGEIEEVGQTLLENSMIKAKTVHNLTQLPAIADDTGLEVEALNGAPGIYAARYAGEDVTYEDNVNKLLAEMENIPLENRKAQFRTVISFVDKDRELWTEGTIKGIIGESAKGKNGFGYDPVFFVPELEKTFSELSIGEKNKISHRGLAMKKFRILLREYISDQSTT
ncbi:MAG: RdgB/HAM1 family non-canonical purine NTP pyrophosphatase [Candidatus Marinimicrobia bacterium]|jgi:XTP/dITP diphosphohydrolase|nr:RdgB/HAM1 family non-canonical purine NTP pyrophosphatase [Candidatus Neomarinimicrobiota bacterium]MDP7126132.1 RdgB/HAM1 family non-canonical purine NTP pyrophosphatase [Candidatus Neomarinimicrobiota bacterium]MDP7336730.1 RdgB/HAM1 family non-canonical purine NTP pyrophosphatase [Candidatus Neomarinimicrobiota bacterium]MDP7475475.1 RdgB/HAM1 family non-canonical purine NTP pyrophosphatase [Candidatus Neomarinimicrobiota bacterium]MEE1507217.1 RdgB/HAM1 family non-canonical purine NTP py|tara:strand:- start:676 stop:1293 length:618 start_codon:yes stop_codon:yes gene_type:complete